MADDLAVSIGWTNDVDAWRMTEDASTTIDDFADSIGATREEETAALTEDLAVSIGCANDVDA